MRWALFALCACAHAPEAVPPLAPYHPEVWVRSVTDRVGPRMTGTPGNARAVSWAVETMKAIGFSNVRTERVTAKSWVRGLELARVTAPVEQPLSITALGGSVGTDGVDGEVVEFDSLEALEASPTDSCAGKIAFINQPMERTRDGSGYGRTVGARFAGAAEAAKHGAVAFLLRSLTPSNARFPHTGAMGPAPIPAAALAVPDAELLHRLGAGTTLHLQLGCHAGEELETANVIGEVPGRERPEEIVLLGAHLDSWDLGQGALDDGAGIGIVLEAGKALLVSPPRRTVRIVLFANEESGLAGGRAYAKEHAAELDHHVLAIEADSGGGPVWGLEYRTGNPAEERFRGIGQRLGVPVRRGGDSGADLSPMRGVGVPFAELRQDASAYFDYHHTADDTFDKVDAATLARVTAAMVELARAVADSTEDLGRLPPADRSH